MTRLPPNRNGENARPARGQTGFDFLVGMSVFLVTLGIVLSFVPGMFQPFDTNTGPNMVIADRSASLLAADLLVEDVTEPGVLNASCTVDFFDQNADDADCRFDHNGTELPAALGVDDASGLNVTIESNGSVLDLDGGVRAAAGPAPPSTADVVVGKRAVSVDDDLGVLLVRVW